MEPVVPAARFVFESEEALAGVLDWLDDRAPESGLDPGRLDDARLVVREIGSNLLKYAEVDPRMYLQLFRTGEDEALLDVTGVDAGPGMDDLSTSPPDRTSSGGGLGIGLGVIRRNSDRSEVVSVEGEGTVVSARFGAPASGTGGELPYDAGGIRLSHPDEQVCGDHWWIGRSGDDVIRLICADGMGHGVEAARASERAVDVFRSETVGTGLEEAIRRIHEALQSGTRGAVVALAEIDVRSHRIRLSGVGNIGSAVVLGEERASLTSFSGTCGLRIPTVNVVEKEIPEGASVVLHSDGVSSRWTLSARPHVHPTILSSLLVRIHGTGTDDTAVIGVTRRGPDAPASTRSPTDR